MTGSDEVERYLAAVPAPEARAALEHLRATIASAAPDAVEAIAYGMPAFRYRGRFLVSYAAWTKHLSLYPLTDPVRAAFGAELAGQSVAKGTIRFTSARPLSDELVRAVVADRRAAIEAGDPSSPGGGAAATPG